MSGSPGLPLGRRGAMSVLAASGILPMFASGEAEATAPGDTLLSIAATSPWLCNGVAATADGTLFFALPRFVGHDRTPSLAKRGEDGTLSPFPGGTWNGWAPGGDATMAFVNVNAVHVFADDSVWAVDQGTHAGEAVPGGAKIVRLDPRSGAVLTVIRFGSAAMPDGAMLNDLRIHDRMLYATDSGLGGILVHDLLSGRTLRRLSGSPLLRKPAGTAQKGAGGRPLADGQGRRPQVESDLIELDADGAWLYWAPPAGPLRRIATDLLLDPALDDAALARAVQTVAAIPTTGGTAIDTLGNLYLADAEQRRIAVLTPQGRLLTLVQDDRLVTPDALFIDKERRLLIPVAQLERIASHADGVDRTQAPWQVLALPLPGAIGGVALGDAVTGRAPARKLAPIRGIEHVAMTVPDMEAAIRFLEAAFDATVLYRHHKRSQPPLTAADVGQQNGLPPGARMLAMCQVRLGSGPNVELFQIDGLRRTTAAEINDIGLVHCSIAVDDLEAATARFAAAGGTLLGREPSILGSNETGPGNRIHFGRTPWGTWIEFIALPSPLRYEPGARAARWIPD